jgi:7tm Odorant receptor.
MIFRNFYKKCTAYNLTAEYTNNVLLLGHFYTLTYLHTKNRLLCVRLQRQNIERAVDLTDSFTWEDLPTRDTDTGQLTAAGWIPTIKMFSARVAIFFMCIHFVQSTIRIVTNHETQFNVWYPFDWTASPFYELVNISQVTVSLT